MQEVKIIDWTWTISPLNTFVTFDWEINGIFRFYVHITRKYIARPIQANTIDDSINKLIGIGLWQFLNCTWQVIIILSALVDIINNTWNVPPIEKSGQKKKIRRWISQISNVKKHKKMEGKSRKNHIKFNSARKTIIRGYLIKILKKNIQHRYTKWCLMIELNIP